QESEDDRTDPRPRRKTSGRQFALDLFGCVLEQATPYRCSRTYSTSSTSRMTGDGVVTRGRIANSAAIIATYTLSGECGPPLAVTQFHRQDRSQKGKRCGIGTDQRPITDHEAIDQPEHDAEGKRSGGRQ